MKRFEFLDHTADVILQGHGDTLAEAFAAAADGLFAVITDLDRIAPTLDLDVAVEAIDREGLLVAFLSELIIRHEVDRIVAKDFAVVLEGDTRLAARGRGEKFDERRHECGMHVKAVSYHMIEVVAGGPGRPARVRVVLDV
ncbi:MAG TPA: archease [candidate division Zixibacteria bacterium]|nr:archease [candidate division Zixibacteria bacterium]MDD4917349.1 archease [candidate division Zixibacteria bacterium]MDM7971907.1 archease [candidate division Zixibacteria bacterium]HOD66259.1 archease [candidate division Zixibacteria bacterium]HOZ06952.1 archease [candidate division Zixibacteria bacterium]